MVKRAVYAGSFDIVTNGHLWMIQRAAEIFDELIVAVGVNPQKNRMFSLDESLAMLHDIIDSDKILKSSSISLGSFSSNELLVNFTSNSNATFIVRGIRNEQDFRFEHTMRQINFDIDPKITTVFFMPPRDLCEVSSSMIKGIAGLNGWESIAKKYVPQSVLNRLVEKIKNR